MKHRNTNAGFVPIIALVIVAILAIGGGVYYSKYKSTRTEEPNKLKNEEKSNANVEANAKVSTSGTLRGLLAVGRNVMCTIDGNEANGNVSGTMYISSDGMMRGDFTAKTTGSGTVDSHMIRQGDTLYAWSGSQGAKMSYAGMSTTASSQSQGSVDLDKQVNYRCSNWEKDATKFTAPTTVKFIDVGAMMKANGTMPIKAGTSGGIQGGVGY